jgi:hypothetical protein
MRRGSRARRLRGIYGAALAIRPSFAAARTRLPAQVIQELIELAKEMREANFRGEKLNLSRDELAFYDALEANDSTDKVLEDRKFDNLDVSSSDVVRQVFPGKELITKTLEILNENQTRRVTRGQLVAALEASYISEDIKKLVTEVAGE